MATVLMVDDSRTSRKILRETLERGGFTIVGEAANGEEGYLKYKELKPDIVTMDITMPTMDGIESLSLIKREDKDAKVIMITAAGQKEKMVEALKRGAEEFIIKPFDEGEVLDTLNRVAERMF
ncbi:MAG: response regulator [Acetatifactor sp.]|nr:response regulator [Acetatifactor sp.]